MRQTQYEMFVGLHRERYFPSTLMPKLELVSDLPAAILNKMPSKIPLAPTANRSMIIQEMRKFWVIPENKNSGSIVIMLRRPAELREILITYGPTSDPRSDPHTMDLRIGYYLDDMKLVYSVNTTYFHSTYPINLTHLTEITSPHRKPMRRARVPCPTICVGHL